MIRNWRPTMRTSYWLEDLFETNNEHEDIKVSETSEGHMIQPIHNTYDKPFEIVQHSKHLFNFLRLLNILGLIIHL